MVKFVGISDQIRFFKNITQYDGFIDFSSPFISLDTYVFNYLQESFFEDLNCQNTTSLDNVFYIGGKYCISSQIGNNPFGMPTMYARLEESNTTDSY